MAYWLKTQQSDAGVAFIANPSAITSFDKKTAGNARCFSTRSDDQDS